MACPFCALGCRDGSPQIAEVNRNWKIRQLAVHPDHSGGSTEASTFLNQTRDYALVCLINNSTSKPGAISCQRHGKPSSGEAGNTHPEQYRQSTASASADKFPPPAITSANSKASHKATIPRPMGNQRTGSLLCPYLEYEISPDVTNHPSSPAMEPATAEATMREQHAATLHST